MNFNFLFLALFFLIPLHGLAAEPGTAGVPPDQALQRLLEGNRRFVEGKMLHTQAGFERNEEMRQKQTPFVAILSCSDSRVPPEIIFDQGRGDVFVARVAGNTIDDLTLGSLEYGAAKLGSSLILVLGHEKCGAVDATLQGGPLPGHIQDIANLIAPALKKPQACPVQNKLDCAIRDNVHWLVEHLKGSKPVLAPLIQSGKLRVVGAYYDLDSGKVEVLPGN